MKHKKRSAAFPLIPNNAEYCVLGDKKKRKYPSELEAELAKPATNLSQYLCPECGYWHNDTSS